MVQWISQLLVGTGDAAGMMATCLLLSSLWALASGNLLLSLNHYDGAEGFRGQRQHLFIDLLSVCLEAEGK